MLGVAYMCQSQLLLEETMNSQNTDLLCWGHLNSVVFNFPATAFVAGTSVSPNHKSQQQPSFSIPALLVQLLICCGSGQTCLYRAIIASSTKPKKNQPCTFSPTQVTASCAALLLLHARGLFKRTSASQSLHKKNLPYLGSPKHVQHVPSCSEFVGHGHCQGRQHSCWLCVLSQQAKSLSTVCPPGGYPTITVLTARFPQQPLHSLGDVHHSAFTTHSS